MRKVLQVLCVLLVVAAMAPLALADTQTNVVVNGNFATTADLSSGFVTLQAGSTALTGWTISGSVDVVNGAGSLWQAAPSGGNSVDLSGSNAGSVSQSLNTPSGLYTISFYLAGNYASSIDKTLQVSLGNQSWTYVVPGGNTAQNMGWQLITINGVSVGTNPTALTFASLTSGAYGPVIAGVSVVDPPQVFAVPEPASMLLFGTGLIGLARFARRRLR